MIASKQQGPFESIWWLVGLVTVAGAIVFFQALGRSLYFDADFADGAFQVSNQLRRWHGGQEVGRDFQVFHGVGSALIHYPIFAWFGGDFRASEIARQFISPFVFVSSTLTVFFLASRSSFMAALGTVVMFVAAWMIYPTILFPGNSLVGVRSTLPFFAAAMFFVPGRMPAGIGFAIICGAALVVSTDQGIAAIAAALLTGLVVLIFCGRRDLLAAAIASPALALLMFLAICGSETGDVLRYNFHDTIVGQAWYFGAPPNLSGLEGLKELAGSWQFGALAVVAPVFTGLFLLRLFREGMSARIIASTFLFFYGCIALGPMLVYISPARLDPLLRAVMTGGLLLALPTKLDTHRLRSAALPLVVAALCLFYGSQLSALTQPMPSNLVSGVKLSPQWQTQFSNVHALTKGAHIWSDYAGVVEESADWFQPGADFIVHALGTNGRKAYLQSFEDLAPQWVRTSDACAWRFGPWAINQNWDFFRSVFTNYAIAYRDPLGVLWQRTDLPQSEAPGYQEIALDADNCLTVPGDVDSMGELAVTYRTTPASSLPVIRDLPRYLLVPNVSGATSAIHRLPVSLPAAELAQTWTIPIRLRPGTSIRLCPVVTSDIADTSLTIILAKYRTLEVDPQTLDYLSCN